MPVFTGHLASKLPHVGTTIFTVMSRLAQEHNAINLSQGFPDFDCTQKLRDLLTKYVNAGLNQYPPMAGVPALRERIVEKMERLYGMRYDVEDEVTVVPGATYAIFNAIATVIRPGDEVILFEPAYDSYEPAITVNGGKAVFVPLDLPDYAIDWERVRNAITPLTKMIIVNTPHNPTATVFSAEDLRMLEGLLRGTDIVVVSDEVYEHIVFDGQRHESVTRFPGLAERSFFVSSFGKTYSVTGWKMGYVCAPKELMAEFRKVHQFNVFVANSPVQHALAEYMKDPAPYLELSALYQRKRDLFRAGIAASRLGTMPSRGSFFQCVDYSRISDEKDTDLAVRLTKEKGLASIPVSVFYQNPRHEKVLRFCFAKSDETLERGAEILSKL